MPTPVAAAQTGDRQDATAGFVEKRPGVVSGDFFRATIEDPANPNGKPPAVRRIVEIFPPGSTTDPGAIPHCTASDAELMAQGAAACPPGSHFGDGFAEFVSGFGPPADPILLDVNVFFTGDGQANLATERRSGVRFVTRTPFEGEKATSDFQPQPGGPPDGQTVLRRTELTMRPQVSKDGRRFFSTPSTCPADGLWRFRLIFTYADGVTQEEDPVSPCVPAGRTVSTLPLTLCATPRVSVRPRVVRAGERRRFTLRVTGPTHHALRGAKVWFAGTRRHTHASGRATIVARFRHPSRRRARASLGGCAGRASVHIVR